MTEKFRKKKVTVSVSLGKVFLKTGFQVLVTQWHDPNTFKFAQEQF